MPDTPVIPDALVLYSIMKRHPEWWVSMFIHQGLITLKFSINLMGSEYVLRAVINCLNLEHDIDMIAMWKYELEKLEKQFMYDIDQIEGSI